MVDRALLVITLADSDEDGSWVAEYVGECGLRITAVRERHVEADVRQALEENPGLGQAVVTIDQRFMGFLAKRAIDTLTEFGVALPTLIHPSASVARSVKLGVGVRVAAGAVLSGDSKVGDHTRVLERAVVSTRCTIGAFTTLDLGTLIGEGAAIGRHCWLRAGLVVEPRTTIESSCELGPGGVVHGFVSEGSLHIPGLDGPARIHRFG